MESFFSSLKTERTARKTYPISDAAVTVIGIGIVMLRSSQLNSRRPLGRQRAIRAPNWGGYIPGGQRSRSQMVEKSAPKLLRECTTKVADGSKRDLAVYPAVN